MSKMLTFCQQFKCPTLFWWFKIVYRSVSS